MKGLFWGKIAIILARYLKHVQIMLWSICATAIEFLLRLILFINSRKQLYLLTWIKFPTKLVLIVSRWYLMISKLVLNLLVALRSPHTGHFFCSIKKNLTENQTDCAKVKIFCQWSLKCKTSCYVQLDENNLINNLVIIANILLY